jgi:hypothetical protein
MKHFMMALLFAAGINAWGAAKTTSDATPAEPKVHYKAGKDLNFEQLIIDGELKRPELAIVTGDNDENGNGLLSLRENFIDRLTEGAGKEAQ